MYQMHDLRAKNRQELLSLISELKGKLLALRFETATGQLTETHLIKNTKQDIAKIFTVLKEQEQGIVIKEKPLLEKTPRKRFGKKEDSTVIIEDEQVGEAEKIIEAPLSNSEVETVVEEKEQEIISPIAEVEIEKEVETSPAETEEEKIEEGNS